jgi:uncharacterized membrane protein
VAAYFAGILCASVFAVQWLTQNTWFRHLGGALLAIIVGALFANIGLLPLPESSTTLYRSTLGFVAPLSIFYLTLQVRLRDLRRAGSNMVIAFTLSVPGVLIGAWLGYELFLDKITADVESSHILGMLIAGHIGGSANFNALAIHYNFIENADAFLTVLAVDHIFIVGWIGMTALLPRLIKSRAAKQNTTLGLRSEQHLIPPLTLSGLSALAAVGLLSVWLSELLSDLVSRFGFTPPTILLVTIFALILAQSDRFRDFAGYKPVGDFLVLLFLILVGAHTDFGAVIDSSGFASLLAVTISAILVIHAFLLFAVGRLLKIDIHTLVVGSQACIGGPVSAAALAEVLGRDDLVVPAVVAGSLGAGMGTFIGFAAVNLLLT